MERPQHHRRRIRVRPPPWFGPVAAVVVAVLALTTLLSTLGQELERSAGPPDRAIPEADPGSSQPSSPDPQLQAVIDAAAEECRSVWTAQEAPLETADTSLGQWQVHVDAMNQLVAGEITFAQATDFWEQTRIGAAENVAAFTAADASYLDSEPSCRAPLPADEDAVDVQDLLACEDAIGARDEVLDAARVAIRTWHHHIIDMDMLRSGELSPELALELWQRYWKQGVQELDAYRTLLDEAASRSCEGL